MKRIIQILLFLLVLCMLLGAFASCKSNNSPISSDSTESTAIEKNTADAPATEEQDQPVVDAEAKIIDIYLIAGQSNAVGHTSIASYESAYAFAPELESGFLNVLFSGIARYNNTEKYYRWGKTKLGLGRPGGNFLGPEAGMAKALAEYYNEETGNVAGIIKFGSGGTNLLNVTSGSNQYGNWVSPSYAEAKNIPYDGDGITGKLYRDFLTVVKSQLFLLEATEFTDFRIKGLYWMQGENDRGNPEEYRIAFGYFVQDLRRDLANAVMKLTGDNDDRGVSEMPIFVGTISKTFGEATESVVAGNIKFIEMQKTLPDLPGIGEIVIVDNSDYAINTLQGSTSVAVGTDRYHWNQSDHLAIGYNVGKSILTYYNFES